MHAKAARLMDARASSEDNELKLETRIMDLTRAVSSAHCAVAARDSTAATSEMLSELEEKLEVAGKSLILFIRFLVAACCFT